MTTHDLVIVGGGIAGSTFAMNMAARGFRVLVVERERTFRDRVRGEYILDGRDAPGDRTGDDNVRRSREAIAAATDGDFDVPWSLKMNVTTLFRLPRGVVVRQHISHLSHHRGQMTVYLRLLDVPGPSMDGPTADESWQGQG
jgi:choline dehydrogenase-like flavoprotein